jgi:dethiobiotin synthetase
MHAAPFQGIYLLGTDTNVGKTAIAAGLLLAVSEQAPFRYWKPVQTGIEVDDDTETVKALSGLSEPFFGPPAYRFRAPLSPHLAADKEGKRISPELLQSNFSSLVRAAPLLVEGAGGALVPLAPGYLQIDFVQYTRLPVLLVVHDKLGAINHTLLTLEALRRRNIPILGVILNQATEFDGNDKSIEEYGEVAILGRFPLCPSSAELMRTQRSLFRNVASNWPQGQGSL